MDNNPRPEGAEIEEVQCSVCGRTLTDPTSRRHGTGPNCRKKLQARLAEEYSL